MQKKRPGNYTRHVDVEDAAKDFLKKKTGPTDQCTQPVTTDILPTSVHAFAAFWCGLEWKKGYRDSWRKLNDWFSVNTFVKTALSR